MGVLHRGGYRRSQRASDPPLRSRWTPRSRRHQSPTAGLWPHLRERRRKEDTSVSRALRLARDGIASLLGAFRSPVPLRLPKLSDFSERELLPASPDEPDFALLPFSPRE